MTHPPSSRTEPTSVTIDDRTRTLCVAWADGHATRLPYPYVRGLCPCAVCQGHGGDLEFVAVLTAEALAVTDVLEVGHYALNIVWQDGHRTGIYPLSYLRGLCPCPACQAEQGPSHVMQRLPAAAQASGEGSMRQASS